MKNIKVIALTMLTFVTIASMVFVGCQKQQNIVNGPTQNIKKRLINSENVTIDIHGIPTYPTKEIFITLYNQLQEDLNQNITSIYENYPNGFSEYELDYSALPNQEYEHAMMPLKNFSLNFNSLWVKVNEESKEWLLNGNDNIIDYPRNKYAVDDILLAMIDENGDMRIGNNYYHYINEISSLNGNSEVAVIEIPSEDYFAVEYLNSNPIQNKIGKINQWPVPINDKYHSFDPFDTLQETCFTNKANWGSEDYADRKKYYWKNGFNYDILGSHSFSNMEVWHKSKVFGWIHDLQSLQVYVQLETLNSTCSDVANQMNAPTIWGPYLQATANFWANRRKVEKNKMDVNHNVTSKGYYKKHVLTWL